MSRGGTRRRQPPWAEASDDDLLDLRIADLRLKIAGTWLEDRVEQLYRELEARGLRFRPRCWLSDEWFSPDGVPGIAIPFYLAHPRLMKLEARQMKEVEGGTRRWCMQLLRHEAGHAIESAFQLARRKRWRQLFGFKSTRYPEFYRPKPFSRDYVIHLDWWYGQSHPTEDFAETFAVWLTRGSKWRSRYRSWPALRKLEYVDALMDELVGQRPRVSPRSAAVDPVSELRRTLREHYERKKERYGQDYPDFYDRDLRRLFSDAREDRGAPSAAAFLRKVAPELRARIAHWTGEYAYTIDLVLKDMISRCRELKLRAARPAEELVADLAVFLTMQTMNYLHSRNHRLIV